jgi:hypothetical protein
MRKNATLGVAATIMGLATIFWIKSSVIATSADVRPRAEILSFVVQSSSYLPVQIIEPIF